jgi:hypothetical protein
MYQRESEETFFSMLVTYLESFRKIFFYDNACNLLKYFCREPGALKDLRLLVDKFHSKCHINCPSGTRHETYDAFSVFNSEVCEQFNALLGHIKTQSAFMTQTHFTYYVRFYLSQRNLLRRQRLLKEVTSCKLKAQDHLYLRSQVDFIYREMYGETPPPRSYSCDICTSAAKHYQGREPLF